MISILRGIVASVGLDHIDVVVGGIGFRVHVTPAFAQGTARDEEITVYTSMIVREDSMTLYGFESCDERDVFTTLMSVSGIGPKIALAALAVLRPDDLRRAVRDQDLAMVVNAMWGAGAEAVSINGQRIGPTTFVRTAGSVILVNITPVSSPYVVSAIGDSNALSVALVRGNTGDYLSAAQSVTGMTVSTKVAPSLSMDALAPTAPQYATLLTASTEGATS